MSKSKKELILENLEVTDTSTEGKAIARHENMVVFIEGAVPGDIVDVLVRKKKKSYAEGTLHRLVKPSPDRILPKCEHFGTCGGCKWQNMSYAMQLEYKQKTFTDALTRIGKLEYLEMQPILGNRDPYFYRNKLEFSFSNKRWLNKSEMANREQISDHAGLGYHLPGMFDKVLDINNCYLQPEPSNSIRNAVKQYAVANNLTFFDIRNKSGLLRNMMIRTSTTGEVMLVLSVYEWHEEQVFALLEFLKQSFPLITSLQYVHNNKANDTLSGLEIKTYAGRDHIFEQMEHLRFKISAGSFYQTNSRQAYALYSLVREFAALQGDEIVYDLYTGTGTIGNFIAAQAKKVVGIEYVGDAILDARENSKNNKISNATFFSGDMKDVLTAEFIKEQGWPSLIITDPPRAGMHEDVVKAIAATAPKKIIYVSCNPATQARDLAMLKDTYLISKVRAVDMFPQTAHVESVVLLEKKQ